MEVARYKDGDDTVFSLRVLPEVAEQIGDDSERELAFALSMTDVSDPNALRWLAACAIQRVLDLA